MYTFIYCAEVWYSGDSLTSLNYYPYDRVQSEYSHYDRY